MRSTRLALAAAQRLAAVEGVLGTLLDLVAVEAGWEAAFEAAAGDALTAVIVDGTDTARLALTELASGDATGAVLALGSRTGTRAEGAEFVRSHVSGTTPAVDDLLDVLLADAIVVDGDWQAALDQALARPGQVVVTRTGDRFGARGWRIGSAGPGATGAALAEAEAEVERTRAVCAAAADATTEARRELAERSVRADGSPSGLPASRRG